MLLAVDGYRYGDRDIDRSRRARRDPRRAADAPRDRRRARTCARRPARSTPSRAPCPGPSLLAEPAPLAFEPVPFDHPLYVLFSSGTTGLPKPIVHGHGGILLEHLKALALHTDLGPGDRFCWFTTTGWMMWNYLVSGLAVGSTIVLFDGNPAWPDLSALWRLAAETRTTYLGLSAPFLMACRAAGLTPGARPRPRGAARRRVDRRAAAGGGLPLGRRGRLGRDPARVAQRRHGPVHRVPRAVAAGPGLGRRDQLPDAGREGRGVRRGGPPVTSAGRASS